MKNIIFLLAMVSFFACHKKDETPDYASQVAGTYKGVYTWVCCEDSPYNHYPTNYDSSYTVIINKINNNTVSFKNGDISVTASITYANGSYIFSYVSEQGAQRKYQSVLNGVYTSTTLTVHSVWGLSFSDSFSGTKQ